MIVQRMMVRGVKTVPETWQFTVNTEATAAGEKKTGIPINLYVLDGVINVDWGDGQSSSLSSADYQALDSTASVHTYAEAGVYQITLSSAKWDKVRVLTTNGAVLISTPNEATEPLYYFRRTLVSIDSVMPKVLGRYSYASETPSSISTDISLSSLFFDCGKLTGIADGLFKDTESGAFSYCFQRCSALQSLPNSLFPANTTALDFCFRRCSSLQSIPENLLSELTSITNVYYMFGQCSALGDFSIHIGSSDITNVSIFVTAKSGTSRTVYVPSGSTTETTFNAVAADLGLTIIGE